MQVKIEELAEATDNKMDIDSRLTVSHKLSE